MTLNYAFHSGENAVKRLLAACSILAAAVSPCAIANAAADKPAALVADGIPAIPDSIPAGTRPYMEYRTARLTSWNPVDRSMLIVTRFGDTNQLHRVKRPMGAREQISFEAEPVSGSWSPTGDVLVVRKDIGGNEFYQLHMLEDGKLTLLTDGKSRNEFGAWSRKGEWIGYTSTRRNGTDSDLYVVNPRDRKSDRLVAQVKGGGWDFADFTPDARSAVAIEYISIAKSNLHRLDISTGTMTPIGDHGKTIAHSNARFAPDGTLWALSDEGSDFLRLGTIDVRTGKFTAKSTEKKWDIEEFDIAEDGSFIAYVLNEAGSSVVKVMDLESGETRTVSGLPKGVAGALEIAPWGAIGLTFTSARSAADAYSIDPKTLSVERWTLSETGGLDPNVNVEPELIGVTSFDKEPVSGFLYRPDPTRFPGKRPLIVSIHGGPESQFQPGFLGRNNYLLNELGIAIFYPNVRGSSGFGKRFVSLDNGPFRREDSVKDIGAFLDVLDKDPALDASRIAVTGGSYGGYMCYAVAIRYGERLKGANCVVAISSFVTFLENTQSYRRDLRRVEYGDERDAKQRAKLMEISPLTRVKELDLPLMIVTGANDPRVPASEADQIVAAVRGNGREAWHLLAKNEGHGFAKKENADYQFWAGVLFWQQNLLK
jgi:dipeptidyl aminopeptidase/acylaminoacyl peptidase